MIKPTQPKTPAAEQGVHEYDGIIECDNQLPRWWLATLYTCVAFAAGYWLYYHSFHRAPLPTEEYQSAKAAERAKEAEALKAAGDVTPELMAKLSKDPATVEEGKQIFTVSCVVCHADGGRGQVGPNLTDDYWIHGGGALDVYKSVREGVLDKQMPAWGKTIGEAKTRSVVAYVLSLKGTNVAGGKEPQGEKSK